MRKQKIQVLKIEDSMKFTVIYDHGRESKPYALYYHYWKQNEYGVYTKRKKLLERYDTMSMCLCHIADIFNNKGA